MSTSRSASAHSDDGWQGSEYVSENFDAPDNRAPYHETPTVVGGGGRSVRLPQREREDSGSFGLYNGNWGGAKRSRAVQLHIGNDLLYGPAQIICAQEADPETCQALERGPADTPTVVGTRGLEEIPAVAGDRRWFVIRGLEAGATCMVAARRSVVSDLKLLHWHRHVDGDYVAKGSVRMRRVAYTRILVAEATWKQPLYGEETARFLTVHFHHLTAKRQRFAAAHAAFWDNLVALCVRYGVRYIAGDFNMSLFRVTAEAQQRGLGVSLAACYAWRHLASDDDVRHDSCGIFVVGPIRRVVPLLRAVFTAEGTPAVAGASSSSAAAAPTPAVAGEADLPEHISGQGFRVQSYLGGEKSMRETLRTAGSQSSAPKTDHWPALPLCKEKRLDVTKWDPDQCLFRGGSHFPLLVFFGQRSRRSEESLVRREETSTARGWGPGHQWQRGGWRDTRGRGAQSDWWYSGWRGPW
ncbi:MAG: hypothetical protein GY772_16115 [bacterium]|nr:hypothetical protein [bacterium]